MSSPVLRKVVLPVVIVLAGAAIFAAMVKMRPQPAKRRPPAARPLVEAVAVRGDAGPIAIEAFGTVRAKRSVSLVPQVSGEVVAKSPDFEAGGTCAEGQVLLEIDDTDYVLAYEQARTNLAQGELDLARAEEEARIALKEWERLHDGNPEAPQPTPLVLHEPQLKRARAGLESARAALAQARANLERCRVRAPFAGRILTAEVDAGQYLRAGVAVGTMHAVDVAEVTVSVSDADLAWIPVAAEGGDPPPVDVGAEFAGGVHHWAGRAERYGGAVDSRSRLVPVVVEISDPFVRRGNRPPMFVGMFVTVTFRTPPPPGAVAIPRAALRPGNRVWVVTPERALSIREVTVVRAGIDEAVITSGLAPGDLVCTSNLQVVTDGLPVRLAGEAEPAAEAAAATDAVREGSS